MNKIIIVSVMLVALGASARAQLEDAQSQQCVDSYIQAARDLKVPEVIDEFVEFVRKQDPSGSQSVEDILMNPKTEIDISKFAESPEKQKSLQEAAKTVADKLAPAPECVRDIEFYKAVNQILGNDKETAQKINLYTVVCFEINNEEADEDYEEDEDES